MIKEEEIREKYKIPPKYGKMYQISQNEVCFDSSSGRGFLPGDFIIMVDLESQQAWKIYTGYDFV